jgi:3-oxoadipate enol-lactonase
VARVFAFHFFLFPLTLLGMTTEPIHKSGWCVDAGSGPAIVLLHGYPLDHHIWMGQTEALAAENRLIVSDFPGFGGNPSTSPFTIESLADGIHFMLTKRRALPCVLCGFSMGGYVALAFARKYSKDLRGLILIDTRADADSPQAREGRAKAIELAKTEGSPAIAAQMLPKLLAEGAVAARPELARQVRKIMEACPSLTIQNALAAMRDRADSTDLLKQIAVPTLVIVGESDSITPPPVAEAMHAAIAGSQLAIIRGAGHLTPMEQPEQVNQAILRFLKEVGR